jgi:DNA-binding MarR family transcriptional regulator
VDNLASLFFSEISMVDQLMRYKINRALPKGMELSQFMLLNYLATISEERRPSQLAKLFQLTRGAMTNTLSKLEGAGYVHMRPDWDDARRKCVVISASGRKAREDGLKKINPVIEEMVDVVGIEKVREVLPIIRELRNALKN